MFFPNYKLLKNINKKTKYLMGINTGKDYVYNLGTIMPQQATVKNSKEVLNTNISIEELNYIL